MCDEETSRKHKCKGCSNWVHLICGEPVGEEGCGQGVFCRKCYSSEESENVNDDDASVVASENHDIDSLKYDENPYNEEEKREPQKILLGMKNKKQKSHLKINLVKPQLIMTYKKTPKKLIKLMFTMLLRTCLTLIQVD